VQRDLYSPREDSALLRDAISLVERVGEGAFLEIGCGSTINLKGLGTRFGLVVGTDLLPLEVMKQLRNQREFELVRTDRAACFREGVFDLVAFNPPYLPSDAIRDRTVDGGRGGLEVPAMFLLDARRVKKANGKIVMILSGENSFDEFGSICEKVRLKYTILLEKDLFFERLYALQLEEKERS